MSAKRSLCKVVLFLILAVPVVAGPIGFGGITTGGAGGPVVTVTTAEELRREALDLRARIIQVKGTIAGVNARIRSNTTLVGIGPGKPTIVGNLYITENDMNIIIKDLHFTNPAASETGDGDGISISDARHVWIDHCTFTDCSDGGVDVTGGSDMVTVSWCKFIYKEQNKHRFAMLVKTWDDKERSKKKRKHKARITLHHNWWGPNCDQRMPSVRHAEVHMFNNYFNCKGNSYCTNAREGAEILSEREVYDGVKNPIYTEDDGKIKTRSNVYDNCSGKIARGNDDVFKPPYDYDPDKADKVPKMVQSGAGCQIGR